MRKFSSAVVGALLLAVPAEAGMTVGGHFACVTKDYYDEVVKAVVNDDKYAAQHLIQAGACLILKEGIRASVVERGWTGWVKARLYVGRESALVYTSMEAIR